MHGKRIPEPAACKMIADALGVDPRTVLRLNGHLPPEPEDNPLVADLIAKLRWAQPNEVQAGELNALLEHIGRTNRKRGAASS